MKTWTNPTVEELEVKETAGGIPLSWWEGGFLPGIFGPGHGNGNGNQPGEGDDEIVNPDPEDGRDETTDGMS